MLAKVGHIDMGICEVEDPDHGGKLIFYRLNDYLFVCLDVRHIQQH